MMVIQVKYFQLKEEVKVNVIIILQKLIDFKRLNNFRVISELFNNITHLDYHNI
jgi:hypothetical protein